MYLMRLVQLLSESIKRHVQGFRSSEQLRIAASLGTRESQNRMCLELCDFPIVGMRFHSMHDLATMPTTTAIGHKQPQTKHADAIATDVTKAKGFM
jgi:hypothetical protein